MVGAATGGGYEGPAGEEDDPGWNVEGNEPVGSVEGPAPNAEVPAAKEVKGPCGEKGGT